MRATRFLSRSPRTPRPPHLHLLLLLLLAYCALSSAADSDDDDESPTPTVTTAPVFLPHYDQDAWSLVRGSIISSDASASETTYTIFCPTETPPACDLSLEFPFVIVEGPHTVKFHGTVTSTYTANLECDLNGTVAATCSGYSSYRSNYSNGPHTGPTEISWTSTFMGTDVQWGTLTIMADCPSRTSNPLDITITTGVEAFESSEELYYMPVPTDDGTGAVRVDRRCILVAAAGAIIAVGFIL